jgi:hypothetical protein
LFANTLNLQSSGINLVIGFVIPAAAAQKAGIQAAPRYGRIAACTAITDEQSQDDVIADWILDP